MRGNQVATEKTLERKTFGRGQLICKEGQAGQEAYVLQKGKVRVFKSVNGRRVIIGYVAEREVFGEMALLDDAPRMASAEAVEDCVCIVLKKENIDSMLDSAPRGITVLMQSLLRTARKMGEDLADVRARLVQYEPQDH
jgi:CRP/FNR family cyclic AMP-dependent transcriptional regulator